ncbi:hypothetical protein MB9_2103 [Methanobacterium formicicum]|uniref:Uncharacterized protein n=2 Tax=Methanobacterium formicicum TaxID=2162 RepID=A0A089Z8H8_METFO|nr:hypothetical protein BRM9_0289 [Methanobacterium formicicum]CEL25722.1 hypothetical protein MB9_2103 [Methanobacterium formicicum]
MIIKQHIDTLYDNRDDKISKWDILFFFIFPLILAVGLIYFNKELKSSADSLLVSLSIFTPLLLSLLVLIYDMGQKAVDKEQKSQFYGNYDSYMVKLREITANISFSILISIIVIVFLVVYSLNLGDNWYWKSFLNGAIYYFVSVFCLTLLMILKRTHKLISDSLK